MASDEECPDGKRELRVEAPQLPSIDGVAVSSKERQALAAATLSAISLRLDPEEDALSRRVKGRDMKSHA